MGIMDYGNDHGNGDDYETISMVFRTFLIIRIFEQVRFPLFPVYLTTGFPVIFVNPHLVQSHSHCLKWLPAESPLVIGHGWSRFKKPDKNLRINTPIEFIEYQLIDHFSKHERNCIIVESTCFNHCLFISLWLPRWIQIYLPRTSSRRHFPTSPPCWLDCSKWLDRPTSTSNEIDEFPLIFPGITMNNSYRHFSR